MLSLYLLKDGVKNVSILVTQVCINLSGSVVHRRIDRCDWYMFTISNLCYINTVFDCIQLGGGISMESIILLLHEGQVTKLSCL